MIEWGGGVFGAEEAPGGIWQQCRAAFGGAGGAARRHGPNPRFYERNQSAPGLNRKIGIILARMPGADIP